MQCQIIEQENDSQFDINDMLLGVNFLAFVFEYAEENKICVL
jgi:hypothetical protein